MWDDNELDDLTQSTIVMGGGSVEYDLRKAACPIQELIDSLIEARDDGATHVVASSGNHRGAKWQRVSTDYGWADNE